MRVKNKFVKRKARKIPKLNTIATADISFMLLVFFLVTTSLNNDKVIKRNLPPDNKTQQPVNVDKKYVLTIIITDDGKYKINDIVVSDNDVCTQVQNIIKNNKTNHIVEILASNKASYDSYFHLQNIISRAYNEYRQKFALTTYKKNIQDCSLEVQSEIFSMFPQRISERFVNDAE